VIVAAAVQKADWAVFLVGAIVIMTGAFGVILSRHPVHSALSLVMTLFGIAVEFVNESADFLAVVQVVVYAGAVVILFLFVIMYLGVDRRESLKSDPLKGQRPLAVAAGLVVLVELVVLSRVQNWTSGAHSTDGALNGPGENIQKLGQSVFTRYLLPFEMTSALLVIAVVGAVVLARRKDPTATEMTQAEHEAVAKVVEEAGR
jgi:NADH-quinone oxidoreductase subunit J